MLGTVLGLMTMLMVIPLWRIFQRAGFTPLLALLALIPGIGWAICVLILALGQWRTERGL